jgi:hypothetical protein
MVPTLMRQLAKRMDTHADIRPMVMSDMDMGIYTHLIKAGASPKAEDSWIYLARLFGLGVSYDILSFLEPCRPLSAACR